MGSDSFARPISACHSVSVNSSPINILVSNSRLRALMAMMKTYSSVFADNPPIPRDGYLQPLLPYLDELTLNEARVSLQSLGVCIVDCEEDVAENVDQQRMLDEIVANFISQISCLDFMYPNQNARDCMAGLICDQCQALGLSRQESLICIDKAEVFFRAECKAVFETASNSSRSPVRQRGGRRGTGRQQPHQTYSGLQLPPGMSIEDLTDVMDQIIVRAAQKTVDEFRHRIGSSLTTSEKDLLMSAESLAVSWSSFYRGSTIETKMKSFSVKNGTGVNFLNMASFVPGGDSAGKDDYALSVSFKEKIARGIRQDVYFEAGIVDSVFLPEAYADAIATCRSVTDLFSSAWNDVKSACDTDTTEAVKLAKDLTINGAATSFSVILTDKLVPFIRFSSRDLTMSLSDAQSERSTNTSLLINTIALECVSPTSAEAYPDIITKYQPEDDDSFGSEAAFTIQVSTPRDATIGQTEMLIGLDGVRIVLLRQFVNEVLQYAESTEYGIGLLQRLLEREPNSGNGEKPSQSSKFVLRTRKSSVVLPRDSCSIDLLGVEVEELSISPMSVSEAWSVESYDFTEKKDGGVAVIDEFFDCVAEVSNGSTSENHMPQISRVAVDVRGARLFTSINSRRSSSDKVHLARWNNHVASTGRAESNKETFKASEGVDKVLLEEIQSRVWEEITAEPLNLRIRADWAPTLRLLIEDGKDGSKVALDMRMSQFYLLLSVWYANMQELPLLFPFADEFIEKCSVDPYPPSNWPAYGTNEFVNRMTNGSLKNSFEMAFHFSDFSWRCSYDHPNYFAKDPPRISLMGPDCISVAMRGVTCSILCDESSLIRIGLGATTFQVIDERRNESKCPQNVSVDHERQASFVDMNWGLECGRHTLVAGLPLPFQLTVFMTPDNYCMINLGADLLEASLVDLTPIWLLLDYFGLYFKEGDYGNPTFAAEEFVKKSLGRNASATEEQSDSDCMSIDFRMFLIKPHILVPSTSGEHSGLCVMLETMGLHYRYKSFGLDYSSQDIVARDLEIVVLSEYMEPSISRGLRQVSGSLSSCGVKTLIEGMSFSIKYDFNTSTNYIRLAVRVPLSSHHFHGGSMNGIESPDIEVKLFSVPPPLVCKPFVSPSRNPGYHETTIYFSHDYMMLVASLLTAFVGPSEEEPTDDNTKADTEDTAPGYLFSITAHVERVKLIISDPIIGMHRPILSICLPSLLLTASQLEDSQHHPNRELDKLPSRGIPRRHDNAKDLQGSAEATVFVDYFKLGATRNWEPFVEPVRCLVLHEKSDSRGKGLTLNIDCPLHLNITGALIETLDDAVETFEMFWSKASNQRGHRTQVKKRHSLGCLVATSTSNDPRLPSSSLTVYHSPAEELQDTERVAFSFKNHTGQRIRVHTHSTFEADPSNSKTTLFYLDHLQLMPLSFPATISVIKNMASTEVPIKGDQDVQMISKKQQGVSRSHVIDVQIPGFRWVRGISIEDTGKHFVPIIPRSLSLQAKVSEDWRLKNALQILAEVQSLNGGRRLSVQSPFEIINKTDHAILLGKSCATQCPSHKCFIIIVSFGLLYISSSSGKP